MNARTRRSRTLLGVLAAVPLAVGLTAVRGTPVAAGPWTAAQAPLIQQRTLDAAADIELGLQSPVAHDPPPPANYVPSGPASQCPVRDQSNVKVDQGCLNLDATDLQGRGQAHNETAIAVNPLNANQLLAASNDYKLGDGLDGGTEYSHDSGRTWQNSEVPLEFTRGSDFGSTSVSNQCGPAPAAPARMYWQGGGDPSVAWDTRGNAYFAGLHFNRGNGVSDNPDYSSGVYVYRSTGNGGASWTFPGTPVATCFQHTTPGQGVPLEDKPYMAIDDGMSSPYRDRIYLTWTKYATDGTAYIYESYSSDYGRTFSAPVAVTNRSDSSTLCANSYGLATREGPCNEDQFPDPFVGPDGSLYVAFSNFNNAVAANPSCPVPRSHLTQPCDNHHQILLARSTNGGAGFAPVVQVGQYNELPDCSPYQGGQDFARACVPEKGSSQVSVFRATNYPSGGVNPTDGGQVVVTYGSYINADSNASNGCTPKGVNPADGDDLYVGVKDSGACANKILVSVSSNHGASFSGTGVSPTTMTVVNQSAGQMHTDQWFQWSAFAQDGVLAVSYADRQYGSDERTGQIDFTVSSSANRTTFTQQRATSSSMPAPTMFPDMLGNSVFWGDYTGLAVDANGVAHPLWTDTRDLDLTTCPGSGPPQVCSFMEPNGAVANAEDIFTTRQTLSP